MIINVRLNNTDSKKKLGCHYISRYSIPYNFMDYHWTLTRKVLVSTTHEPLQQKLLEPRMNTPQ